MLNYEYPEFNFAAPLEYAVRFGENEPKNQIYRTDFMRDRDRVLYCSAFRRLSGKTQIYLTGKDDHQRNRLTHTLEVSQIARTISRALALDCDLTEAIALGHDLGHTPFGHAGEQVLHEIMVPDSPIHIANSPMNDHSLAADKAVNQSLFGFKHNVQSVRVAASLESSYGKYGLNLTNFTLWGILHHSSPIYKRGTVKTAYVDPTYRNQLGKHLALPIGDNKEAWSFEAFVVGQADEIAQWHHDLEDALRGQAMTSAEVCDTIRRNLGTIMDASDKATLDNLKKRKQISKKYIADLSRVVVNTLVNRLIECSLHNLKLLWDDKVKDEKQRLVFFSNNNWDQEEIASAIGFKKYDEPDKRIDLFQRDYPSVISEKIHHSQEVERMNAKGQYIIKKLFQAYSAHPQQLPDSTIVQYMIEVGEYEDLASATTRGIGAVRTKFENFLSSDKHFTINNKIALMRKICDHIAGMTDHFAMEEYKNLYA